MRNSIFFLLCTWFLSISCYAVDNPNQEKLEMSDQQVNDSNASKSNLQPDVVAQGDRNVSPKSDPRWYKSREGRREYLKGGSDYPRNMNQSNESNPNNSALNPTSPNSNAQWYKSREGNDYPRSGR